MSGRPPTPLVLRLTLKSPITSAATASLLVFVLLVMLFVVTVVLIADGVIVLSIFSSGFKLTGAEFQGLEVGALLVLLVLADVLPPPLAFLLGGSG